MYLRFLIIRSRWSLDRYEDTLIQYRLAYLLATLLKLTINKCTNPINHAHAVIATLEDLAPIASWLI